MFITLEGVEGSGKTTQIKHIAEYFEKRNIPYTLTREPGGTIIGRKIRSVLLDIENTNLVPEAELFLYAADRIQHISTIINPDLAAGKVVICDRYVDSLLAYQCFARDIDIGMVNRINDIMALPVPNITLLFDLDPKIGLCRANKQIESCDRDISQSRFEQEHIDFHTKVRNGYLEIANNIKPDIFKVINANGSVDEIKEAVLLEVDKSFKKYIHNKGQLFYR